MKSTLLIVIALFLTSCATTKIVNNTRARDVASFESPIYEQNVISSFETDQTVMHHGSTIAEITNSQKLLGCWYSGSREMGPDVQIYCNESDLTNIKWKPLSVVVKAKERQTRGTGLVLDLSVIRRYIMILQAI